MHRLNRLSCIALFFLVIIMLPQISFAIGKEAPLVAEDPVIEARMLRISENLRCLVCQNESIADSRADFSNDLRREIREQIKANKTDEEILEFMVERYGDFVLYDPPLKATTFFLWFGPLMLFVGGFIVLIIILKRRRKEVDEVVPLSDAERLKAEALMELEGTEEKQSGNLSGLNQVDTSTDTSNDNGETPLGENKGNKE